MTERGVERAFVAVAVLLALPQVLILGSGALGLALSPGLALAFLTLAVAGAAACAWRWPAATPGGRAAPPPGGPAASETPAGANRRAGPPGRGATVAAWLAAGALLAWSGSVWMRLLVLALRRPPYDWDGLYYHLPALQGWVQAGRVTWLDQLPDLPFANGYPMAVETLGFLVHALTGSSRLVDGGNLLFWPLAALALAVLAGRLGLGGPWRWLPAGLLAGVPVLVGQSGTCYVDPAFSAAVMASFAAAALFSRDAGRHPVSRGLLLGACLGLMLGTKGLGAPFLLVTLPVAVLARLLAGGLSAWRRPLVGGLVALAAALAVGVYWYARNMIHTGNPLFPVELRLGERLLAAGYDMKGLLAANMPDWLASLPRAARPLVSWLQPDAPVTGYAPTSGLGYLWLAGGLPAALWALWRSRRRGGAPWRPAALLLGVMVLLLFLIQPAPWWGRFTVWLHGLGLPCLALAAAAAAGRARRPSSTTTAWAGRALASLLLVVYLGLAGVAVWEGETALAHAVREGRAPVPGGAYLSSRDYVFPDMRGAPGWDDCLSARRVARSDWSRLGTLLGGVLAMPLDARELSHLTRWPDANTLARLADEGVEWVVWDRLGAGETPPILVEAARERHRFAPAPDVDFTILRLR
ncbi:MAG: hypothetical protein JW819_10570 [Candidatus Krumholzibacteriota bacterium]|nr:hypothetical protein [Candidatus Krumholzibacteriota bacterium]